MEVDDKIGARRLQQEWREEGVDCFWEVTAVNGMDRVSQLLREENTFK